MPFNVEPFARSLGIKDITLEDMFNPLTALEFGRFYLGDLEREFKNPLFIAYAYNGSPGFLRRTLAKKTLFKSRAFTHRRDALLWDKSACKLHRLSRPFWEQSEC